MGWSYPIPIEKTWARRSHAAKVASPLAGSFLIPLAAVPTASSMLEREIATPDDSGRPQQDLG